MACRVTKIKTAKGEDSILFSQLADVMSQDRALENYLELENNKDFYSKIYGLNEQGEINGDRFKSSPKFKEVTFKNAQEELDLVELLTDDILFQLRNNPLTKSDMNLSGMDMGKIAKNPLFLPTVIKTVQDNLYQELAEEDYDPRMAELLKHGADNIMNYIIEYEQDPVTKENRSRLGIIGQRLADHGVEVVIKEKPTDVELLEEELNELGDYQVDFQQLEYDYMRIYSMSVMESNPAHSVLPDLKIFLQSLKEVADYNKNTGEIDYVESTLGHPKNANYGKILNKLYTALVGVQSVSEIDSKIEQTLAKDNTLAEVYSKLATEIPVTIPGVGKVKLLRNALFTLAKQNYNLKKSVENNKGDVISIGANNKTVKHSILTNWADDIIQVRKRDNSDIAEEIKSYRRKLKDSDLIKKDKNGIETGYRQDQTSKIAKIFRNNGFSGVTREVIEYAISEMRNNPKKYTSESTSPTPSSVINTMLRVLPEKVVSSTLPIFKTEKDFGENKTLSLLAEAYSKFNNEPNLGTFRGPKQTNVTPLNAGSESMDIVDRLREDNSKGQNYVSSFRSDPIYSDSLMLDIITNPENPAYHRFERGTFLSLENNNKRTATEYNDLSTMDALTLRMNVFFAPEGSDKSYFQAFSPTLSDRGRVVFSMLPKLNYDMGKKQTDGLVFQNNEVKAQDIKDWIATQVVSELKRIQEHSDVASYKTYKDNVSQFNLFTDLNEFISDINPTNIQDYLHIAEAQFIRELNKDIELYEQQGIFQKRGNEYHIPASIKRSVSNSIGSVLSEADVQNFLANNFVWTHEQLLFLAGDPAFYPSSVNINKRLALPTTPGVKVPTGEFTGLAPTSNVKIVAEPKLKSEIADMWSKVVGRSVGKAIDLADGFGLVSLDYYKRLLVAQGIHTPELINIINKLEAWKPGDKPIRATPLLTSLKKFYYKLDRVPEGFVAPFGLKYSVFPVIPQMAANYPALNLIYQEMTSNKSSRADEVVVPTAVKVGEHYTTTIGELGKATPVVIDNSAVRFPQPPSTKIKTQELLGSQIRTLIESNSNPANQVEVNGTMMSEEEAAVHYNKALKHLFQHGSDSVHSKFYTDGLVDEVKVHNNFIQTQLSAKHKNTAYIKSALLDRNPQGETVLPISYPTLKYALDSSIASQYRQAVNRATTYKHSAVQIPNFGSMTIDGSLTIGGDLKMARLSKDGNTVLPAEVRVSPSYFLKTIEEKAHEQVRKEKKEIREEAGKLAAKYLPKGTSKQESQAFFSNTRLRLQKKRFEEYKAKYERILYNADGTFNMKSIKDAGLDEVVLYRIPTQGKNSMLVAKIIDFLPDSVVNAIEVPGEIVEQSGSDFDIDKIHIEYNSFDIFENSFQKHQYDYANINTIDDARNAITDFHKAVLSSPQHYQELMTPNSTQMLKDVITELNLESNITASFPTVSTQEAFRINNGAGKAMIGRATIASVGHAVAPKIGAHFSKGFKVALDSGKTAKATLGLKYNLKEGKDKVLISKEIEQIQNASLDNASDPLLGKVNVNTVTSSAALLMLSLGLGLKHTVMMLNAPVVKDYASIFPRFERLYGEDLAHRKTLRRLQDKYNTGKLGNLFNTEIYTENMAESLMDPKSSSDHAKALEAFIFFKEKGEELAKFQIALNIGSRGVPSSVSGLINTYNTLGKIPGTYTQKEISTGKGLFGKSRANSAISVNAEKYESSHLHTLEKLTVHEPLKVLMDISPSASTMARLVLNSAKARFGYLPENKQIAILSAYDTYLVQNPKATSLEKKPSLMEYAEHEKLTDPANPESTANLIRRYKESIKTSNQKLNEFISRLDIENIEGREFVTFNNTTTSGILGTEKEVLMKHYESLMTGTPFERKLARSLTQYALVNYGYSTSINSYMEFIPPRAHGHYSGLNNVAEFFRGLSPNLNSMEDMNIQVGDFLDLYVANSSHFMTNIKAVESRGETDLEALEDIKSFENINSESIIKDGTIAVPYLKWWSYGDYTLMKYNPVTERFEGIQRMGIPNYAVEYHGGPSVYRTDATVEMDTKAEKNKTTVANKVVLQNIEDTRKKLYATVPVAATAKLSTVNDAYEFRDRFIEKIRAVGELDQKFVNGLNESIGKWIKNAESEVKRRKEKPDLETQSFETVFKRIFDGRSSFIILEGIEGELSKKLC